MEGDMSGCRHESIWSICVLFSVDQTHANVYMAEITTTSSNNNLTNKFKLLRIMLIWNMCICGTIDWIISGFFRISYAKI